MSALKMNLFFFFFNDTATTEIYTLSLHDALPISATRAMFIICGVSLLLLFVIATRITIGITRPLDAFSARFREMADRKSTRLNSSHSQISYAVFCLKKKKTTSIATYTSDVLDTYP